MATPILMKNTKTGQSKDAYVGFSWTTLFFGAFPALFRSDFLTFVGSVVLFFIISALTFGIGGYVAAFCWAFFYNKHHALRLLKEGYMLNGTHEENKRAALTYGIELTESNCLTFAQETKPEEPAVKNVE